MCNRLFGGIMLVKEAGDRKQSCLDFVLHRSLLPNRPDEVKINRKSRFFIEEGLFCSKKISIKHL